MKKLIAVLFGVFLLGGLYQPLAKAESQTPTCSITIVQGVHTWENKARATGSCQEFITGYYLDKFIIMGSVTTIIKQSGEMYEFSTPAQNHLVVVNIVKAENKGTWKKESGKWIYLKNGVKQKGWINDKSVWYFLDSSGYLKTGWLYNGNKWYFLDSSGAMKMGWLNTGGKWYFLDQSGAMKTGWAYVDNNWYFLDSRGAMKTGWLNTGGKWYFLNSSGAMLDSQWQWLGGKWYYLTKGGSMATGWQQVGGNWYYLYSNGAMAVNTTIEGSKVGSDGAWINSANVTGAIKTGEGTINGKEGWTWESWRVVGELPKAPGK